MFYKFIWGKNSIFQISIIELSNQMADSDPFYTRLQIMLLLISIRI